MGNEVQCVAKIVGKEDEGKALLETSELIFRGAERRLKIGFSEIKNIKAADGELRIRTKRGEFAFGVGAAAEKWREKILRPKTRMKKLGIRAGMRVAIVGDGEAAFARELKKSKGGIANGAGLAAAELVFWFVDERNGLNGTGSIAKKLEGAAGLWIVYPKGKKQITENDVLRAGRKAGLHDVKVVGFSPTHTALKFVIPAKKR